MNTVNPPGYYQQQPPNPVMVNHPAVPSPQMPFLSAPNPLPELDFQNDALVEPITKCKILYEQLKSSLQLLLNQLNFILNPSSSSAGMNERLNAENQFQLFGKSVENFNRVCDLLIVNLRMACEAQSVSIEIKTFSRYFGPVSPERSDLSIMPHINLQMQRISEYKNLFQRFLANNTNLTQINQ